ncbi:MAG TPA: phosphotransferase [Pseudonocardiaceae bacterium]|nr:phosphotransferase [Pseudonocardiaceae bacterium]
MHVPTGEPIAEIGIELAALLDRMPCTAGRPRTVEDLPGGLTNRNLKVTTPDGAEVVRISAGATGLLSIDRDNEHANSHAAATTGVGAPVRDYLPGEGVLVVGFLPGRILTNDDLADPAVLGRVARSCRTLHAGPRFVADFDMFDTQRRYLKIVRAHGFRLPSRYLEFAPAVARIERALAVCSEPTVPCNNDLLAANLIDDGAQVWIIEYEYSGNNDACFELGNIWSEADLSLAHLEELVGQYYGRTLRNKLARARLLGLMSKYGWTLWASIQGGASSLDFDFWSWGMEKYDRAVVEFNSPHFDRMLEDVQRTD